MSGKHFYEYAVIRVVPRVEREEFINVGLIMYCKRAKYIKARYVLDEQKLRLFSSELDLESLLSLIHIYTLLSVDDIGLFVYYRNGGS